MSFFVAGTRYIGFAKALSTRRTLSSFPCLPLSSPSPPPEGLASCPSPRRTKNTTLFGWCFSWLGRSDSNTRMTESESVALPLGDAPMYLHLPCYFIKLLCFLQAILPTFRKFFQNSAKKINPSFFLIFSRLYNEI